MTVRLDHKVFIFEFKVADQKLDRKAAGAALEQIRAQRYADKYRQKDAKVYLVGVQLDPKERNITQFEWEAVE